ncbi:Protein of unknown function [Paenibacillus sp. cl141a]|uniref:DUF3100 domain-containing protein n=1 Tax=unclassified Paenibacillus TaxID=185978 RepID=UPI0001B9EE50|nr:MULTISPECIES: DUF3100 domain-containing protein [unclassified Paenibacillus]ACX67018.1 conserved hypothetical protein [Paenibacillus sp. Y412MC10]RAR44682.1 DUF3100 domain-containing protein [Paenibacillus sp. MDMC362]SEK95064.1 Protein of unknown function [Paenibacillus sp. cl141a]
MKLKLQYLYLLAFVLIVIAVAEFIGIQSIQVGSVKISLLPLVFAILITMVLGLSIFRKGLMKKIYSKENVGFSSKYLIFIMLPLMARYGADVAPRLEEILKVGWVFIIQEIGNLGTILLGLPIAILLGLRREAIGATLGLGREGELAYISEKYTLDSDEGRGVLSLYIIGTLFGTLFFSILAPVMVAAGFSIEALAMSSGVGSASMMTGSSSALIAHSPEMTETINGYAAASQLLTSFLGTYTMVFLAVPLQRFMYKLMVRGEKK